MFVINLFFFSSKNIVVSLPFLKDFFCGIEDYRLIGVSFNSWKKLCHFSLDSMISDEKSTVILD